MENQMVLNSIREVYDVKNISLYLDISESITRRLVKQRKIPYLKIEGCYRFYLPRIQDWLSGISIPTNNQPPEEISIRAEEILNRKR